MSKQNTTDGILDLVDRCLAVIPPAEPSLPRENDIQCHIHHLLAQRQSPGRCISEEPLPWDLGQEMIKTPSSPSMSRPPWCGLAGQASRMFVFTRKKTDKSERKPAARVHPDINRKNVLWAFSLRSYLGFPSVTTPHVGFSPPSSARQRPNHSPERPRPPQPPSALPSSSHGPRGSRGDPWSDRNTIPSPQTCSGRKEQRRAATARRLG